MSDDYSDADFIRGPDGQPLRLFHGTTRVFTRFSMAALRSAGTHFGCVDQANHFSGRDGGTGGRVFPVFLRSRGFRDLRDSGDLGWERPHQTLFTLKAEGILTEQDVLSIAGSAHSSLREAYVADLLEAQDGVDGRQTNRRISGLLAERGIDCIAYSNRQEPRDGRQRDAYLVMWPSQIVSAITGECLG